MADQSKPRLIEVGRVAGGFGVRGEVRITAYTEDPLALKAYGTLLKGDGTPVLTLTGARLARGGVVGRAKEIETKEQADALRGLRLYVPRDLLPPTEDEDEFYLADLIGLEARAEDGSLMGRIKAVQNFGAGDILEVQPAAGGATVYYPFTKAVAPVVSIAGGYVTIVPPEEIEAGDAREDGDRDA